jgi:hypothetical protein
VPANSVAADFQRTGNSARRMSFAANAARKKAVAENQQQRSFGIYKE